MDYKSFVRAMELESERDEEERVRRLRFSENASRGKKGGIDQERLKKVKSAIDKDKSRDDIMKEAGISERELGGYLDAAGKGDYKRPGFLEGLGGFIGDIGEGIYDSTVGTVVDTAKSGFGGERGIREKGQELSNKYRDGDISFDKFKSDYEELTGNILGWKYRADANSESGFREVGAVEDIANFAGRTFEAGSNLAITPGSFVSGVARNAAQQGVRQGAGAVVREGLKAGAREAAFTGTASLAGQALQGEEDALSLQNILTTYGADAVLGGAGEIAGAAATRGGRQALDAARSGIDTYNALPRAAREGGSIRVPGGRDQLDGVTDLARAARPELPEPGAPAAPATTTAPLTISPDAPESPEITNTPYSQIQEPQPGSKIDDKITGLPGEDWTFNKEQRLKDTRPQGTPVQKFEESLLDSSARLKKFDEDYSKLYGTNLNAENNPHDLKQLEAGADDTASELIKPLMNDLKYNKKNGAESSVSRYGLARQIVDDRAGDYPPSLVQESQQILSDMEARLSPEEMQLVKDAADRIVQFNDSILRRPVEAGMMSEDWYNNIKKNNSYYFTPFNFEEYVNGNRRSFAVGNSSNASKTPAANRKGLDDAARFRIEDPYTAVINNVYTMERNLAKFKTNNAIYNLANAGTESAPNILRSVEDVTAKIDLKSDIKELTPIKRELENIMKRDNRDIKRLQTEVNRAEREGLQLSLKNGGQRMTPGDISVQGLGGDVPTSQAGMPKPGAKKAAVDEAAYNRQPELFYGSETGQALSEGGMTDIPRIHIEDLKQYGYGETMPTRYKRSGGKRNIDELASNAGYDDIDQFLEAVVGEIDTRATGRQNTKQLAELRRDPAVQREAAQNTEVNPSMLGPQDTQAFLNNLIENGSRADIDRLKAYVGRRDQKMATLLDTIGEVKSQYDEVSGNISADREELRKIIEQGKDVSDGYEAVEFWKDGKKVRMEMLQPLADSFKGKNDIQLGTIEKVVSATSRPFKELVTILAPGFSLTDSVRNFQTFNSTTRSLNPAQKALFLPAAKSFAQGVVADLLNLPIAKEARLAGAGGANTLAYAVGEEAAYAAKKLSSVKTTDAMWKEGLNMLAKPYEVYKRGAIRFNRALEYGPKIAEYKFVKSIGGSDEAAAIAARRMVGDMQAGGAAGRVISAYMPFTNSIIQGNKAVFDYAKKSPATFGLVVASTVAMPTITGYAWNQVVYPEVLANIPEYVRENNHIIIFGDDKDEDGNYTQVLKIPKNELSKVFGNPIEAYLAQAFENDPASIKELLLKTVGYATPVDIEKDGEFSPEAVSNSVLTAAPIVKAGAQLQANKDFFSGQDITPESLEGLDPEDQVKENTKGVDKVVSAATGGVINPLEAESLRKTMSGSAFDRNPAEAVSRRFVGASGKRSTGEFYKIANEVEGLKKKASRAINAAIERGDNAAAQAIAGEYNELRIGKFAPWVEKYQASAEGDLFDKFNSLKLNLSSRSIKQRQTALRKEQ